MYHDVVMKLRLGPLTPRGHPPDTPAPMRSMGTRGGWLCLARASQPPICWGIHQLELVVDPKGEQLGA